jgi:hypothetical protein
VWKKRKIRGLSGFIVVPAAMQLVVCAMGIIVAISDFINYDEIHKKLVAVGAGNYLSKSFILVTFIALVATMISLYMILKRKAMGIYILIAASIVNCLYDIITTGFNISYVESLILPAIIIIFIYRQKEMFGF